MNDPASSHLISRRQLAKTMQCSRMRNPTQSTVTSAMYVSHCVWSDQSARAPARITLLKQNSIFDDDAHIF